MVSVVPAGMTSDDPFVWDNPEVVAIATDDDAAEAGDARVATATMIEVDVKNLVKRMFAAPYAAQSR
jgi:hypothetical protein